MPEELQTEPGVSWPQTVGILRGRGRGRARVRVRVRVRFTARVIRVGLGPVLPLCQRGGLAMSTHLVRVRARARARVLGLGLVFGPASMMVVAASRRVNGNYPCMAPLP